MSDRYTCEGSVCGGCGVQHRTIGAAQACCDRHHAAVVRHNSGGAYSDRNPVRCDGRPLTEWEVDELYHWQDTH